MQTNEEIKPTPNKVFKKVWVSNIFKLNSPLVSFQRWIATASLIPNFLKHVFVSIKFKNNKTERQLLPKELKKAANNLGINLIGRNQLPTELRIQYYKLEHNITEMLIKKTFTSFPTTIITDINISDLTGTYGGTYEALWDTGSEMSSISTKIVSSLNLKPTGNIVTARFGNSATQKLPTYYMYILDMQNNNRIHIEVALTQNPKFDIVIGLDFISLGSFLFINSHNNMWDFQYKI